MQSYSPEEIRARFDTCWEIDEIAELMEKAGLKSATVIDALDAPTDKHIDIIWLVCIMEPSVAGKFADRCSEDVCTHSIYKEDVKEYAEEAKKASPYDAACFVADVVELAAEHFFFLSGILTVDTLEKYRGWLKEEVLRAIS